LINLQATLYMLPDLTLKNYFTHRVYLRVSYEIQNKQQLFPKPY
jgi:hypothetical protein